MSKRITRLRISARRIAVERHLISLVENLYREKPDHSIFRPVSKDYVAAPYKSKRANGVNWISYMKKIANRKYRWPLSLGKNQCWMTKQDSSLKIYKGRSVKIVRVLAFFKDPTDANYELLNASISAPFDHFCQRGGVRPEQGGYLCINGIEHGSFSTQDVNESRKSCTNGARCLCPGHGPTESKCIFTHPDGKIKRCRNLDSHIPMCTCKIKCY